MNSNSIYFSENGRVLNVNTPKTPLKWDYFLYNNDFYGDYDINMQGSISRINNFIPEVLTQGYRYFYVCDRESGEVWNPNYLPLHSENDSYNRKYGIEKMELVSSNNGIETEISMFVPANKAFEVWQVTLKNKSDCEREIDLFSVTGLGNSSTMGGECVYENGLIYRYTFPYHTFYEEKEKVEKNAYPYMFMITDTDPLSCDMSQRRFFGSDDLTAMPQAVKNGKCSNIVGEAESFCGAMQHSLKLSSGEEKQICFAVGNIRTKEMLAELKKQFNKEFVEAELAGAKAYWDNICSQFKIKTPVPEIDTIMNYNIKKQSAFLSNLNRKGVYCPVRNRFQDAMGCAFADLEGAKNTMLTTLKQQRNDGSIQQWYMTDGSAPRALCLLSHCDGPVWIVICMIILANQLGDAQLYDKQVEYIDGGSGTVYEHMLNAVYFMGGDLGRHGLCLMHDGDWTDPANGSGRLGRGESTWATMAVVYCINELKEVCKMKNDEENIKILDAIRERLTEAINKYAWSDDRYVTGFDDDGKPFGDKADDDRIFLNSQTWGIISGVADDEKAAIIKETLKRLKTPFGYLVVDPAFEGWNGVWGRISVKKSGTTENGAVYCHASVFKAFMEAVYGNYDECVSDLLEVLPTNPQNPVEKNMQLPLYIPNYYYGLRNSPNFGRSSQNYGTGTIAWFMLILLERIIGVEKTVMGIRINPHMPQDWDNVYCERLFKKACYKVSFSKDFKGIEVNKKAFNGKYLPYKEGEVYEVRVGI